MTAERTEKSSFIVLVTGEIEKAVFPEINSLYCKYNYVYGPDWKFISGVEEGLSPSCEKGQQTQHISINTPIEATFSSTNPFKWPQLIISCYGHDMFGNDVIRGYGATFIPTAPGRTQRSIAIFVPQASTTTQRIMSFFTGRRAEFVDSRIVSMSQGREITRVSTQGLITVTFNVVLKDVKKYGYDVNPATISRISEFPLPHFEEKKPQKLPEIPLPPPPTVEQTEPEEQVEDPPEQEEVHEVEEIT
ncbi:unnamed protein product [Bursaphelenchus okinawaensis]|uniref:B9 domain-containing protein 1 n=1 Tax=Bursaphelenchus okinawaensis TaxID=465554 RepID=A0A811LIK1_9BILA|nr:unnamed protein product [Bursaphelenchus okinawaensis]CAG9124355.1 unnamed protein product [Bursaphelenchus okinawaensis]